MRLALLALVSVAALGGLFFALRPAPEAGAGAGPAERSFEVRVTDGGMEPAEVAVAEGDRVELDVTTEDPVELHVHGYDLEEEVEPGDAATLSFAADLTGRFPVEDHASGAELGTLVVEPR